MGQAREDRPPRAEMVGRDAHHSAQRPHPRNRIRHRRHDYGRRRHPDLGRLIWIISITPPHWPKATAAAR